MTMKEHTVRESILKNTDAVETSSAWQRLSIAKKPCPISLKSKNSVSSNEKKNIRLKPSNITDKDDLPQDLDELSSLHMSQSKRKTFVLKKQNKTNIDLLPETKKESNSTYVLNCLNVENYQEVISQPKSHSQDSTKHEVKPTSKCDQNNSSKTLPSEEKNPQQDTESCKNIVSINKNNVIDEQTENDVKIGPITSTEHNEVIVRKSVRARKKTIKCNDAKEASSEPEIRPKRGRGRPKKCIEKNMEEKDFKHFDETSSNRDNSKAPSKKCITKNFTKRQVDKNLKQTIEEINASLRNDRGLLNEDVTDEVDKEVVMEPKIEKHVPKKASLRGVKRQNTEEIKSDETLSK